MASTHSSTPPPTHVGYGLIASLMSSDADLNIFRSFVALNVRNILYLQSELAELETELQDLDKESNDRAKGVDVWKLPRSWKAIKDEGGQYLDCVERVREVADKYSHFIRVDRALQSQAWLLSQKHPAVRPRTNLINIALENQSELSHRDAAFIMDEILRGDLITLSWNEKEVLSRFLETYLHRFFKVKTREVVGRGWEMSFFSEDRIRRVVRLLAIIFSSVLPILSIVVLYNITSQSVRLSIIVAFSALCSAVLATLTNARSVEIMAATATFAAVQVVFISGGATSATK